MNPWRRCRRPQRSDWRPTQGPHLRGEGPSWRPTQRPYLRGEGPTPHNVRRRRLYIRHLHSRQRSRQRTSSRATRACRAGWRSLLEALTGLRRQRPPCQHPRQPRRPGRRPRRRRQPRRPGRRPRQRCPRRLSMSPTGQAPRESLEQGREWTSLGARVGEAARVETPSGFVRWQPRRRKGRR